MINDKEFDINEALAAQGFEPIGQQEEKQSNTSLPEGFDPNKMTFNMETPVEKSLETTEERIARCREKLLQKSSLSTEDTKDLVGKIKSLPKRTPLEDMKVKSEPSAEKDDHRPTFDEYGRLLRNQKNTSNQIENDKEKSSDIHEKPTSVKEVSEGMILKAIISEKAKSKP